MKTEKKLVSKITLVSNQRGDSTILMIFTMTILLSFLYYFYFSLRVEQEILVEKSKTYLCFLESRNQLFQYINTMKKINMSLAVLFPLAHTPSPAAPKAQSLWHSLKRTQDLIHKTYIATSLLALKNCTPSQKLGPHGPMIAKPFYETKLNTLQRQVNGEIILKPKVYLWIKGKNYILAGEMTEGKKLKVRYAPTSASIKKDFLAQSNWQSHF
jgi:hypothetical protein